MTDTTTAGTDWTPPPLPHHDGRYACTGTTFWMCTDCGAAVDYIWGRTLHDRWHDTAVTDWIDTRALTRAIDQIGKRGSTRR